MPEVEIKVRDGPSSLITILPVDDENVEIPVALKPPPRTKSFLIVVKFLTILSSSPPPAATEFTVNWPVAVFAKKLN